MVAQRHLPRPAVAAPPVIHNPTPAQVHAAAHQIASSITQAVGPGGTNTQRVQRRVQLINQIQTDPRYRSVRASVNHWLREQQKLISPEAALRNAQDRVKAGPQPRRAHIGIGPLEATVNLTALGQTLGHTLASATPGLQGGSPEVQFAKAGASDLMNLPLAAPQTAFEIGRAAMGLAHGDTHEAKKLVQGLTSGVIGHLARGDIKGAEDYFRQHPVYSVLEVSGAEALAGRAVGAVARTGALGERLAKAASTERPDAVLVNHAGEQIAMRRHGSPDIFRRLAQNIYDQQTENRPLFVNHHLRRRADFESDMAAASSRTVRADEATQMAKVKPHSKAAREIVGLVSQGIVRPGHIKADLEKEARRLDAVAADPRNFSTRAQFKQNRATAAAIRTALANPKGFGEAINAARENVGRVNELEARAQELGAGTKERMQRAALFPAAQAHLAAGYKKMPRQSGRALITKARNHLERARGARDHTLERLKAEGVKQPTKHPDYVKAAALVAQRKQELSDARAARMTGAPALRDAQGNVISNAAIRKAVGEPVAYLPHHTKARGARAYYQTAFSSRKTVDSSGTRTGEAFRIGAHDASYKAVQEHRIRLRGVVNRIAEHDRLVHAQALKGKGGRMFTWDQATKIAQNIHENGGPEMVPYRAVPGSYDKARIDRIASMQNATELPDLHELMSTEFANRLKEPAAGDRTARNVVLLPKEVADQLGQQMKVSGTVGRVGNVLTTVFRTTVLPFSAKWLTGNVVEAGLRLGVVGAGPNALRIGHRLLGEMDKVDHEQALRVRAALTGGLLYGNRALEVRRFAEHFEGTALHKPAQALSVIGHAPVIKQLGAAIRFYRDGGGPTVNVKGHEVGWGGIFGVNRALEHSAQVAALGKYAKREMQEMTGSWLKATTAQEKALHDIANGLMDSKNIHDAAKYIDETLGQYSRFSPGMRRFIQSYAPFLPWYLNSARFVYWTLPGKHPIKTAIMANAEANLQKDYEASHQGLPPGSLMGDIVTGSGTVIPSSRYTPFGAFAELFGGIKGGDKAALFALVDPVFPQYKSFALALLGKNFAGRDASTPNHNVDLAVSATMAINSLAEAFVPGVAQIRRLREGGASPYDNSTVVSPKTKPGQKKSIPGALNRMFNPFKSPNIRAGGGNVAPVEQPPAPGGDVPDQSAGSNDPWEAVYQQQAAQQPQQSSDPWDAVYRAMGSR